mmetsp:Transcript_62596/g.99262  ORF Transcript_62596/g.99262 Transcript_62596/m.99262 type:complete len:214 (+) Transcript_62596:806-1447(+)
MSVVMMAYFCAVISLASLPLLICALISCPLGMPIAGTAASSFTSRILYSKERPEIVVSLDVTLNLAISSFMLACCPEDADAMISEEFAISSPSLDATFTGSPKQSSGMSKIPPAWIPAFMVAGFGNAPILGQTSPIHVWNVLNKSFIDKADLKASPGLDAKMKNRFPSDLTNRTSAFQILAAKIALTYCKMVILRITSPSSISTVTIMQAPGD